MDKTTELLVKQGSLAAGWHHEHANVGSVAVASDPVHGALITAVLWRPEHVLGNLLAKEGALSATWHREHTLVGDASVASDPVYGPMIGLETYTPKDYVKLGKLSATWVHEWNASFLVQVAD